MEPECFAERHPLHQAASESVVETPTGRQLAAPSTLKASVTLSVATCDDLPAKIPIRKTISNHQASRLWRTYSSICGLRIGCKRHPFLIRQRLARRTLRPKRSKNRLSGCVNSINSLRRNGNFGLGSLFLTTKTSTLGILQSIFPLRCQSRAIILSRGCSSNGFRSNLQ